MKKKMAIGIVVACLTAGIGLVGCGASSNTGETTTTVETKTTDEIPPVLPHPNGEEVEQITVPDVVGKRVEEARYNLEMEGFGVYSDSNKGEVLSQKPSANSLADKGSIIQLITKTGEEIVKKVPNLVGLSESEAVDTIVEMSEDDFRINYSLVYEYSDLPFGEVIDMYPKADMDIKNDMTLSLTVSRGKKE